VSLCFPIAYTLSAHETFISEAAAIFQELTKIKSLNISGGRYLLGKGPKGSKATLEYMAICSDWHRNEKRTFNH
jgi:hypothetical protein